ncbi:hypothetical protein EVAR_77260_1 [Eumeta japonica]|uniref:Uncharacterized protein n=1 Tax=Eumeta variegata TaxID=151549 RepID=A0A4C1UMM9_EUMVA|nr:hypothetical protein EVAR_77260_1 [Eumeta japonica]
MGSVPRTKSVPAAKRSKQVCEPPECRWSSPPMDIRNRSALPLRCSSVGIGYNMENGGRGSMERKRHDEEGVDHRNSHSTDK